MCGILAVWNPCGDSEHILNKAVLDLKHRGPDVQKTIYLENKKIFLAHTRLKIIDISDNANQPFFSPCGRWVLIYNGEIYNFKEIKIEIGDRWLWKTKSDTEVLLAAWTVWGKGCLNKLIGMFAFIILDNKSSKFILVRDRFGIKPLYKYLTKSFMAFSSEIPPLLRFQKQVSANNNTIRSYLEYGSYDYSEKTFFNGIDSVLPGTITEISLYSNHQKSEKWYDISNNLKPNHMSEEEIILQTEKLISQSILSNLVSDVNIGLNVSGGVDSSMLVRKTIKHLGHADLFTQNYPEYSELPWVQEISEGGTLNVEHLTFQKINNFLHDTIKSQAEPFGGVFVCGYNSIYKAASLKNIRVLLDGNGVDEIFLGYEKYHQLYVHLSKENKHFKKIKKDFLDFWGYEPKPFRKLSSIDGSNGIQPTAIHDNLLKTNPHSLPIIDYIDNPIKKLAVEDLLYYKIPRGLRFNDRVSMFHSCELRVPFLDHRLVEFALSIPNNLLLNELGSKVIFRKVLSKFTSNKIAFAKKRSIQSPQREWLSGEWKEMVQNILGSKSFADREWINPKIAKSMYLDYLEGKMNNSFFIWQWINLELWARIFIDGCKKN